MRCHAYYVPDDLYSELETQILEQMRDGDRTTLLYLVGDHDVPIELLSGEWRLLFEQAADFHQVVDAGQRRARMAISPDELEEFGAMIRNSDLESKWRPISFGIDILRRALPENGPRAGVFFMEEGDDWMWTEHPYEIQALPPDVYALLEPQMRELVSLGDHAVLARMCGDHCEGAVEFSKERWETLLGQAKESVPELVPVIDSVLAPPSDYTSIREAIALVSDPTYQPSLDAWMRVHANAAQYALYFRDVAREI